jgi:hypothetical protein
MADWWDKLLKQREQDGITDADQGRYDPPYTDDSDPQNQDEIDAYRRGFMRRRDELGDAFKWGG